MRGAGDRQRRHARRFIGQLLLFGVNWALQGPPLDVLWPVVCLYSTSPMLFARSTTRWSSAAGHPARRAGPQPPCTVGQPAMVKLYLRCARVGPRDATAPLKKYSTSPILLQVPTSRYWKTSRGRYSMQLIRQHGGRSLSLVRPAKVLFYQQIDLLQQAPVPPTRCTGARAGCATLHTICVSTPAMRRTQELFGRVQHLTATTSFAPGPDQRLPRRGTARRRDAGGHKKHSCGPGTPRGMRSPRTGAGGGEQHTAGGARRPGEEVEGPARRGGGVEATRPRERRPRQWWPSAGSRQPTGSRQSAAGR